MAHASRRLSQVAPNKWRVKCNTCKELGVSRRGNQAILPNVKEAHDWWREHEASPGHQQAASEQGQKMRADKRYGDYFLDLVFSGRAAEADQSKLSEVFKR
mgnify:CR=1 FL=1